MIGYAAPPEPEYPLPPRSRAASLVLAILILPLATPQAVTGQVRGSERATVSQVVDGTHITIDYARPHVRGRDPAFGGIVGWDHVWTPGANEATTLEASRDVELNGVPVPAGRYSVWIVPRPEQAWELVLEPNAELYHTQPPEPAADQIRLEVEPETSDFTEALTFEFPLVGPSGTDLRFRWGTTAIPLRIDVQPSPIPTLRAEEAAPYEGTYRMTPQGPPPPGVPEGAEPPTMNVEITYGDGRLEGHIAQGPEALPRRFALIPVAEGVFNPAWYMEGEIFEIEVDMYFEFTVEEGTATGFDVRGLEDRLMMRARRED